MMISLFIDELLSVILGFFVAFIPQSIAYLFGYLNNYIAGFNDGYTERWKKSGTPLEHLTLPYNIKRIKQYELFSVSMLGLAFIPIWPMLRDWMNHLHFSHWIAFILFAVGATAGLICVDKMGNILSTLAMSLAQRIRLAKR